MPRKVCISFNFETTHRYEWPAIAILRCQGSEYTAAANKHKIDIAFTKNREGEVNFYQK